MNNKVKDKVTKSIQPLSLEGTVALNTSGDITYRHNGAIVVDLTVIHPETKQPKVLRAIRIKQTNSVIMQNIHNSTQFMINIPDVSYINTGEVQEMVATIVDGNMRSENQSIPDRNLKANYRNQSAKNKRDSKNKKDALCKNGKFNAINEKKNLHTKPNLKVIGNNSRKNSASLVIDNTTDEIVVANSKGDNLSIGKRGATFKTKTVDMGESKKKKNGMGTMGGPGKENELADMYPKSNLLLSAPMVQPSYLPDLNSIMIGVGYVYKIIKVVKAANEYVKGSKEFDGRPSEELKTKQAATK